MGAASCSDVVLEANLCKALVCVQNAPVPHMRRALYHRRRFLPSCPRGKRVKIHERLSSDLSGSSGEPNKIREQQAAEGHPLIEFKRHPLRNFEGVHESAALGRRRRRRRGSLFAYYFSRSVHCPRACSQCCRLEFVKRRKYYAIQRPDSIAASARLRWHDNQPLALR